MVAPLLYLIVQFFRPKNPLAIIVPHHNVVADKRIELLAKIHQQRPKIDTVFLFSPDHFSANQQQIIYSTRNWQLSSGNLLFANDHLKFLQANAIENSQALVLDHGIYNILPNIKQFWPEAKVVPVLLGQGLAFEKLNFLVDYLRQCCKQNTLIIASVDFSHYLPRALANIHDLESYFALINLDIREDSPPEVDSPQALYLVNQLAQHWRQQWQFFHHSNSSYVFSSRDAESTSHIFAYQKPPALLPFLQEKVFEPQTFLVAKDLDLARDQASLGKRFFYGVDYFQPKITSDFLLLDHVSLKPISAHQSTIALTEQKLVINLSNDLAIAGVVLGNQYIHLVFLPLEFRDGAYYLLTGHKKTNALDLLLGSLPTSQLLKVDANEGALELFLPESAKMKLNLDLRQSLIKK